LVIGNWGVEIRVYRYFDKLHTSLDGKHGEEKKNNITRACTEPRAVCGEESLRLSQRPLPFTIVQGQGDISLFG
jgi:hypothetical protein